MNLLAPTEFQKRKAAAEGAAWHGFPFIRQSGEENKKSHGIMKYTRGQGFKSIENQREDAVNGCTHITSVFFSNGPSCEYTSFARNLRILLIRLVFNLTE
jgi:hypothetical protein